MQREKRSDVTIVTLKLAMNFALFFANNCTFSLIGEESLPKLRTFVSPLLNGAKFTLSVAKNVALFETVRILRKIRTVKWRDGVSNQQNKISRCTALLLIEEMNQIITK